MKHQEDRAYIYSLGATFYYALTGKDPVAVIETSEIGHWREMILTCMRQDPSERYYDVREIVEFIEKTPADPDKVLDPDKCPHCGATNRPGASYCHQCRAGLVESCPGCGLGGILPGLRRRESSHRGDLRQL